MYTKCTLIFEMLKCAGMLYEVRHQGPNKICEILERYNAVCASEAACDSIEDCRSTAAFMAKSYLDAVYNSAEYPLWFIAADEMARKATEVIN